MRSLPLLPLALLPLTLAHTTRSDAIAWTSCSVAGYPDAPPMLCGNLSVPLDYTDPDSQETVQLELLRIEAVKTPVKGSILLNFGGPGANGRTSFAAYSNNLLGATGGYHDLVTWVPRGTNNTLLFSCYASAAERTVASLTNPIILGNSSDVAVGRIWADSAVFDAQCLAAQNATGQLVGTAFTARDMMGIVDALDEDGLLRYWGISYGSVLGATAAAMFPDRVDKVVLDGVVNVHEYYANRETQVWTNTDDVFMGFCEGCISNPANCSLAADNITASALEADIYALIDKVKYHPVVIPLATGYYIIDYTIFKGYIIGLLYTPVSWPFLSNLIKAVADDDKELLSAYFTSILGTSSILDAEAQYGIKCGDATSGQSDDINDILPTLETRREMSRIAGDAGDPVTMRCIQWKIQAKERYSGGFTDIKTKNPVLFIGNTYDPVTPLVSAKNVSAGFEDSVVLQQDGYGHTSFMQASLCTAKHVASYFNNGTLPKTGTKCKVDAKMFSNSDGWDDVLAKLG